MNKDSTEKLRFPIGNYEPPQIITENHIQQWIEEISILPHNLKFFLATLSEAQLKQPYRPGGWTGVQVVHHLADSHINAFIRFKLTLTEDTPTIKPYFEERWALLPDVENTPLHLSVDLLVSLHAKWTILLKALSFTQFSRQYLHPQYNYTIPLSKALGLYAWHGKHHLAHLALLQ